MTINYSVARRRLIVPVVLIGLATTAAVALATPPGTNGRIAFRRYADAAKTSGAVFTINPDGTGISQVTHPPAGYVDEQPNWAPDGKRLVFCRIKATGLCTITIVNADGTGLRRVTRPCDALPPKCVDRYQPSFTPDGRHIVYTRAYGKIKQFKAGVMEIQHSAVATMGVDGRGERVIYRFPDYAGDVEYAEASPNGRRVAFERANGPTGKNKGGHAVFVVKIDGSGLRQLTPWKLAAGNGPDWAPDGSRILLRSNEGLDETHSQYYTVRPDGTQLKQLTNFDVGTKLFKATYSPDGTQIVFGKGDAEKRGDLWAMNADGTNQHPILDAPEWDSAATWGPGTG
jgi:Tol biopolymer transport system component